MLACQWREDGILCFDLHRFSASRSPDWARQSYTTLLLEAVHILQSVTEQWRSPARALFPVAVIQLSEIVHTDRMVLCSNLKGTLSVHNLPEITIALNALKLQFKKIKIRQKT